MHACVDLRAATQGLNCNAIDSPCVRCLFQAEQHQREPPALERYQPFALQPTNLQIVFEIVARQPASMPGEKVIKVRKLHRLRSHMQSQR